MKKSMKKVILSGVALSLFLSGCGAKSETTKEAVSEDVPTLGDVALAAAEQRAAYYQDLAADLEKQVLELTTTLYGERTLYEAQIDALEAALDSSAAEALFTYEVKNGCATVTGYKGEGSVVVIPSHLGGVPVDSLADNALAGNTTLVSVTLSEGIARVGWFAFSGCSSLTSITLPASLEKIEYGAFDGCPATLTVYCPAGSYAAQYAESYGMAVKSVS